MSTLWIRALTLALLLTLLGLGTLSYLDHRPPRSRIDLVSLFPIADTGPVLAPQVQLGNFEASTFLRQGWGRLLEIPFRVSQGPAQLVWSQTQPTNVTLDLEGRCLVGAASETVDVELNGKTGKIPDLQLTRIWQHFLIPLASEQLTEGLNFITLKPATAKLGIQWRTFAVRPQHSDAHAPLALSNPEHICLYYGSTREFSLLLQPSSAFLLSDLSPWNEPGAPRESFPWNLTVRLQSAEGHLDKSWQLTGTGEKKLRLPVDKPTRVVLSLTANAAQDPLPGQLGLSLFRPRVDSWTLPDTSPTPVHTKGPPIPEKTKTPNLVIYLIDTLRVDHVHCYGYANATTPNLDKLAAEGVRFDDVMSAASWTKPSCASILTSLSPHVHCAEDFADVLVLKDGQLTLAQTLSQAGYDTRGLVSNPFVAGHFGFDKGFAKYEDRSVNTPAPELVSLITPWLSSRERKQKPFFLYLHTIDPHMPYTAPKKYLPDDAPSELTQQDAFELYHDYLRHPDDQAVLKRVERTRELYDAAIRGDDEGLGQLVDVLKRKGLYDNTMIVVIADHGEEFFDHNALGHMSTLYQELEHVPVVIKYPQERNAGTVVKEMWRGIDVAPTALRGLGQGIPSSMEGTPWEPGVKPATDRPAFFSTRAGAMAAMFGQGKGLRRTDVEGVRVGNWKYIYARSSFISVLDPIALYDLSTDPKEQHNLAYERPEIRAWLSSLLHTQELLRNAPHSQVNLPALLKALHQIPYHQGP